jgi:hypothetical protein
MPVLPLNGSIVFISDASKVFMSFPLFFMILTFLLLAVNPNSPAS